MEFKKEKEKYVSTLKENIEEEKIDKSKKGFIDEKILDLVNFINSIPDYYTTSSCSGRIIIMGKSLTGIKKDTIWYLATHDYIKNLKLEDGIFKKMIQNKNIGIIKQESAILHICANTIENAQKMLDIAKFVGFKHSGIMATNKRIMIEIMATERMDIPIYDGKNEKIFLSQEYLDFIIEQANSSMKKSINKINKYLNKLKEEFINI